MTDKQFDNNDLQNNASANPPVSEFIPDFGDGVADTAAVSDESNSIAEDFASAINNDNAKVEPEASEQTKVDAAEEKTPVNDNQYQPRYGYYTGDMCSQTAYADPQVNAASSASEVNDQQTDFGSASQTQTTNANSGEYRYRPPYATYGSNCPPPRSNAKATESSPSPDAPKKKSKKKKVVGRSFTAGAVALVIVACLIFSFGAGFGGAYLANRIAAPVAEAPEGIDTGAAVPDGDSIIMYKSAMVTDAEGEAITEDLTIAAVADIVADSVVEITTEFQSSYGPYQFVSEGAGSGVIISENGHIITNNHVIVDDSNKVSDSITVRLKDTTEYKAEFIGADADMDIAILKIEPTGDIKPAILGDSSKLNVGQHVVAVGNPLGELGGTVTSGIVSATGRTIDVDGVSMTLIQTDAAVNPGNSGGGLFNLKGELVGVVNAKSTGEGVEGLGFAIPYNEANKVATELMEFGYVKGKPYLGVSFIDITNAFDAYRYFGTRTLGVYVASTESGYNDGVLVKGDRVVKVNDTEIATTDEIRSIIKSASVDDVLTFTVFRNGSITEVEVTCYEYIPEEFRE